MRGGFFCKLPSPRHPVTPVTSVSQRCNMGNWPRPPSLKCESCNWHEPLADGSVTYFYRRVFILRYHAFKLVLIWVGLAMGCGGRPSTEQLIEAMLDKIHRLNQEQICLMNFLKEQEIKQRHSGQEPPEGSIDRNFLDLIRMPSQSGRGAAVRPENVEDCKERIEAINKQIEREKRSIELMRERRRTIYN